MPNSRGDRGAPRQISRCRDNSSTRGRNGHARVPVWPLDAPSLFPPLLPPPSRRGARRHGWRGRRAPHPEGATSRRRPPRRCRRARRLSRVVMAAADRGNRLRHSQSSSHRQAPAARPGRRGCPSRSVRVSGSFRGAAEHQQEVVVHHHRRREERPPVHTEQHGTTYDIDGFARTFRVEAHHPQPPDQLMVGDIDVTSSDCHPNGPPKRCHLISEIASTPWQTTTSYASVSSSVTQGSTAAGHRPSSRRLWAPARARSTGSSAATRTSALR